MPPVNAFWSLTLYDPEGYFYDNALNRYAINSSNKYVFNKDGSLDIYIQHAAPSEDKKSNWLPAPTGDFNLLLRLYWPKPEVINGKWQPPVVQMEKQSAS